MSDDNRGKTALAAAINQASKGIRDVIKVVKRHADDLKPSEIIKAYAFLEDLTRSAQQEALTARATSRSFSLDGDEEPETAATFTAIMAVESRPAPTTSRLPPDHRKRAEGRLAGTKGKEVVFSFEPEQPQRYRPEPGEVPDKTGAINDIGFIED